MDKNSLDYILNHLGEDRSEWMQSGSPPIFMSSIFAYPDLKSMQEAIRKESEIPFYSRGTNPGLQLLEKKMAALEGGEACLLFASGSAAIAAAVCSQVKSGDHIICVDKPYSWTGKLLRNYLSRFGVESDFVQGDEASVKAALKPNTRVLYLESPNSFTFEIQDIAALSALVKPHEIKVIIDNSYATPLFQNPLKLGADIVVHTATKYLAGHSDALGGVLICSKADREKIFAGEYMTIGGVMAPMNAWLILRGLRTLPLRLEKSAENGLKVARFLEAHPAVEKVWFPWLESFEGHLLAKKQMKGCGGLLSFTLKTDNPERVESFVNALQVFQLACSWGSYESLCYPAIASAGQGNYANGPYPINMIRLYCGLESSETLVDDLSQALKSSKA
jgi:cystathionine beta-lyase/cystathionine gamma-synthase